MRTTESRIIHDAVRSDAGESLRHHRIELPLRPASLVSWEGTKSLLGHCESTSACVQGASTHVSVFLGLSRQAGTCVAPLARETQAAPLALKCLATANTSTVGPATIGPAEAVAASSTAATPDEIALVHLGLRMTVRLSLDDSGINSRPLHACARSECGCLGVFYTCFGGGGAELCATVGLEEDEEGTRGNVGHVRELFGKVCPTVGLVHNGCGQSGVPTSKVAMKVLRSEFDPRRSEWRLFFRPTKNTGSCLAQAKVQWGKCNSVSSGGFEVRTKPHKWILVQDIPSDWTSETVREFLAEFDRGAAMTSSVAIVRPSSAEHLPHAFVQLKDRSEAHEIMKGFRARGGWSAVGGSQPLISFLAGLSRAATEDPTYASVPVAPPSLACPTFIQLDHISNLSMTPSSSSSIAALAVATSSSSSSSSSAVAAMRMVASDLSIDGEEEEEQLPRASKRPREAEEDLHSAKRATLVASNTPSAEEELWSDGEGGDVSSEGDRFLDEMEVVRPVTLPQWRIDGHRFMPAAATVNPTFSGFSFPVLGDEEEEDLSFGRPHPIPFAEASYQSLESLSSFT
jgi:hypothetical protein